MIIGRGHPREVVVVANFCKKCNYENKMARKGQFPMIIGCILFNMGASLP